ncbi:MAG: mechanosensitive ion channel family protein [Bacilli bacterium]|nr:mechanosensitive ion channel family protein [Bacilli bacterium]
MNIDIAELFKIIIKSKITQSIIAIIIVYIIYKIISNIFITNNKVLKEKVSISNKGKTYIKLLSSILRYVFLGIALLCVLKIYNVNITSLLAGIGIIGVVIGLAIQDALKDIIRGTTILSDNYFRVGDVVKYNNIEGEVMALGLKTTRIRDIANENIISISNRKIDEIAIVSKFIYIDIPLPYELKLKDAEAIAEEISNKAKEKNEIKDCIYRGVKDLADSSIKYQLKVECKPKEKLMAKKAVNKTILEVLEKYNIQVPYNQLDIHTKNK